MSLPWFRMYGRFITDPVVEELAICDQRHFVYILCMKCTGILDKDFPSQDMRERAIARRLGLQGEALEQTKQRLVWSGLIDEHWQPRRWDELQFKSDADPTATERQRRRREKMRHGSVTRDSLGSDSDTDTDKNSEGARGPEFAKDSARAPEPKRAKHPRSLRQVLDDASGRKPN